LHKYIISNLYARDVGEVSSGQLALGRGRYFKVCGLSAKIT
jgi:hypothetical protein